MDDSFTPVGCLRSFTFVSESVRVRVLLFSDRDFPIEWPQWWLLVDMYCYSHTLLVKLLKAFYARYRSPQHLLIHQAPPHSFRWRLQCIGSFDNHL